MAKLVRTLQDFELKELRSKVTENDNGKFFSRSYAIPPESRSLIPSRGDILILQADDPLSGDQGTTDLFKVRIVNSSHSYRTEKYILTISAVLPVPFSSEGTSTTFQELYGSRDEHNGPTRHTAIILGISTGGTDGPAKGDFFTGDSGLLGRRCNDIIYDKDAIPGLVVIRATYTAFVAYNENTGSLIEVRGNRRYRRRNAFMSVGVREWVCLTSEAQSHSADLRGQYWPETEGEYAPRCFEPEIIDHPEGIPGISMIRGNYRSKSRRDLTTSEARLYTNITSRREKREYSADGEIQIHGTLPESVGLDKREVIEGSDTALVPYTSYILVVQVPKISLPYSEIDSTVGFYNATAWTKPRADVGQLLFVGAKILESTEYHGTIQFYLDFRKLGWDKEIISRTFAQSLVYENVLGSDGKPIGKARMVTTWQPGKKHDAAGDIIDAEDVVASHYLPANLSFIKQYRIVD